MASPQCEDGYCKIANELLEAICGTRIVGEQLRVLFTIIRKTYGFNKKSDAIPISQITKVTKLPRQSVCRALKALKQSNIITGHAGATRMPSKYAIQKDWEKWCPSHADATSSHADATRPSHAGATNLVTPVRPSKDNTKDTNKRQKTYCPISIGPNGNGTAFYLTKKKRKLTGERLDTFNQFWEAFAYKAKRAEAADAWMDIPQLTESLVQTIIQAAEKTAEARPELLASGQTPKMAQGWLSGRRWEDEVFKLEAEDWVTRKERELAAERIEAIH